MEKYKITCEDKLCAVEVEISPEGEWYHCEDVKQLLDENAELRGKIETANRSSKSFKTLALVANSLGCSQGGFCHNCQVHDDTYVSEFCENPAAIHYDKLQEISNEIPSPEKVIPDFEDIKDILSLPNFVCGRFARTLRHIGHDIPRKAEDEQAHVLYFFLEYQNKYGNDWELRANDFVANEIKRLKAEREG